MIGVLAQTVALLDASHFCLLLGGLLNQPTLTLCTDPDTSALVGGEVIPSGVIESAHFVSTNSHVQVTGRFKSESNGSVFVFDSSYPEAKCEGYSSFFGYIEPNLGLFCLRCCRSGADCEPKDTPGCQNNIPGDYDDSFSNDEVTYISEANPTTIYESIAYTPLSFTQLTSAFGTPTVSAPLPTRTGLVNSAQKPISWMLVALSVLVL